MFKLYVIGLSLFLMSCKMGGNTIVIGDTLDNTIGATSATTTVINEQTIASPPSHGFGK